MAQTLLAFESRPADLQTGFDIGWDHARHGLPPPAQAIDEPPLHQGWSAGRACFGARTLAAPPRVRRWLALRLHAWRRGLVFELAQVTPHYLGQIEVTRCPVTRQPLGAADASVDRVCDAAGYAAGNLALLGAAANRAKGRLAWDEALQRAHRAASTEGGCVDGLDAAAWTRVAVLVSFVTPLAHAQAARIPLRVLPPNRLRLLNPVQGLQALVTRELARPDGTRRLRALSELLPGEALRTDFARFLSALLPRCLQAGRDADMQALRDTLEDAWADARVNRCWQRFALQLDGPLVQRLLERGAAAGLAGTHLLLHESSTATEGWALETRGRVAPPGAARRAFSRPLPAAWVEGARIGALRSRIADGHLPA
ncbi:MAG TPA: hypothetical protein PKB14_14975 [Rubrivivax sp.]|nr:hypothetical protein [Rubrivivax sp.]